MNFFKKLFKSSKSYENEQIKEQPVSLALDDSFVHHFIDKGGKFLYCIQNEDVVQNLKHILDENNWNELIATNKSLKKFTKGLKTNLNADLNLNRPFFTTCEFLIAENGSILFSSNQLEDKRLSTLTKDFIVFATTSQIVKSKDESLTGIKLKYKNNLPTNISPIKNYKEDTDEDNFLIYGTTNSKNLYLLLLEDL